MPAIRCRETGKIRFREKWIARTAIKRLGEAKEMHVYYCRNCDGFHIGHNTLRCIRAADRITELLDEHKARMAAR